MKLLVTLAAGCLLVFFFLIYYAFNFAEVLPAQYENMIRVTREMPELKPLARELMADGKIDEREYRAFERAAQAEAVKELK
jgi:uncharacterized membrane protein